MSAQFLRSGAACHSLRNSCLLSRRARVSYSHSALSSIASRTQDHGSSTSASTSNGARTATRSDSQHTATDTRDPLDPTRLDRYLSSIKSATLEPTLDDVEQCKPASFSRPDSSRYAEEYRNLLETLCRSFSKDQLRRFTELYKLDSIWTRSSRRKTEYAESIIEKVWGWPSLKEIERKRRDATEVLVQSFAVTPSQLFLIMGKDGADLLQLSVQYNVHISLASNPLSLRAEGLRGSLKELIEHISTLKKGIIDETFELPTGRPVRSDLLQRISRLSGAYVENHGNRGKVRICAKDMSDIATAKRLALRASLEVGTQAHTVCYEPPGQTSDSPINITEPPIYSIYPFATPWSFPWTMHAGSAFRLRRVADWLGANSYEDTGSTGGMVDNSHRLLNFDQSMEELSQLVRPTAPESTSCRKITASLGHILMPSGDKSQRPTLVPPFRGTQSLPEILKWIESSATPLNFVPSIPPAITTVTTNKSRFLHRLVYKTLPDIANDSSLSQHVLKFEIELADSSPGTNQANQGLESEYSEDVISSDMSDSNSDFLSPSSDTVPGNQTDDGSDALCQLGTEKYINLMFPDRPMDVQFCVFESDEVALARQPQVLQAYAHSLGNTLADTAQPVQPNPPLTFNFEGKAYYLHECLRLRQSYDSIPLSTTSNQSGANNPVEVCSENIMDLQTGQTMGLCQVQFDGAAEGPDWEYFLRVCDQLSATSFKSRGNKDNARTVYIEK